MKKDLPKVYGLNVEHDTNTRMAYTKSGEENIKKEEKEIFKKPINQKIKDLFNSTNYIYKIDAVIEMKDKVVSKRLVGRTSDYLITMENEQIPISEILDIYQK